MIANELLDCSLFSGFSCKLIVGHWQQLTSRNKISIVGLYLEHIVLASLFSASSSQLVVWWDAATPRRQNGRCSWAAKLSGADEMQT